MPTTEHLAAATALAILRPRRDWEFALHPVLLIGNYLERQLGRTPAASVLRRELALNLGASVTRNEEEPDRMMTVYNIGSVLLAIQIVAWVVSIATGR